MSISNYSELQASIALWINRDDMTAMIPDFIRLAEARIATDFKTQQLSTVTTITVDAASKSLPSNYKGAISAHLDTDPKTRLDYFTPDEFDGRAMSSQSGKPVAYTIRGGSIYFAPSPDATYSCLLTHYAMPDLASDTTNSLLTNYPNLYLFASIIEAFDYTGDDSSRYETKYLRVLDAAMNEADYHGALAIHLSDIQ